MTITTHADNRVTVHHDKCEDVLRTLADASVDSVVTDPPYELGFMGRAWDASGIAYRVDLWEECLRVLKPGGHLLAFGGTRTWHRLTCAIEDAGFEIRDTITWLYGSGFPKSLNVSRAIDLGAGAERPTVRTPYTTNVLMRHGGENTRPWMEEAATRGYHEQADPNTPATEDAARWEGWGTALKPASEPIVVARKPLAGTQINVLATVESSLRKLGVTGEIRWTSAHASDAGTRSPAASSSSTTQPPVTETYAESVDGNGTPNGAQPTGSDSARSRQSGAQPTESTSAPMRGERPPRYATQSSPPTAELAPVAASEPPSSSPSTTSREAAPPTGRRSTGRFTSNSAARDSRPVTESYVGTVTGLSGSLATVRIERLRDGTFVWPDGLPSSVPGGSATVAANVTTHGTGALNIDGCRVDMSEADAEAQRRGREAWAKSRREGRTGNPGQGQSLAVAVTGDSRTGDEPVEIPAGRWPSNVVLAHAQADDGGDACADGCVPGCPVAELDAQSGNSHAGQPRSDRGRGGIWQPSVDGVPAGPQYGDEGGASRFFPTFRYQAKADGSERPRAGLVAHPTVKPLALMRWLVRLVTPPGGLILDPFAGSGTTGEAAILEGMRAVLVERESDYLPLIADRLTRRTDPVAHLAAKADRGEDVDLGLFAFLNDEET